MVLGIVLLVGNFENPQGSSWVVRQRLRWLAALVLIGALLAGSVAGDCPVLAPPAFTTNSGGSYKAHLARPDKPEELAEQAKELWDQGVMM